MPGTYINSNMHLGNKLDHITAVVTNAKKGAQIKARVVKQGQHQGEIWLYAKAGVGEKLKNCLPFFSEDRRRIAAREVLRCLGRQLNAIPGMQFCADDVYSRADPVSVFGKCRSLPKGDGQDLSLPTAKGRSLAANYAVPLQQAQALLTQRFERIFFPVEARKANLFVFQRPAGLRRLHEALEAAGCPPDEVEELTRAMRSYVKQCNDAYIEKRPHRRRPVDLGNGDQLLRADYAKVERFVHFWFRRARLQKLDRIPRNDGLERAPWLPYIDLFIHKNFQRSLFGPLRVGEDRVMTPKDMLFTHQNDTPNNLTYLEIIDEFVRQFLTRNVFPKKATIMCAEHLAAGLALQPRSVQLEFIASNGREFKGQLMLYILAHGETAYRDGLGFFHKPLLLDMPLKVPLGLGLYYEKRINLIKEGDVVMIDLASKFIDGVYAHAAARLSYQFENRNALNIDGTRFVRVSSHHPSQDGYQVQEFAALVPNAKGKYIKASKNPKERLIVMKPKAIPDELDEEVQIEIRARRLDSAVSTVHWGKSLGALMQVEEAGEMKNFDCQLGSFAKDRKTGTVRVGPYVYMIRDNSYDVGQATLFQRLDVYRRRQAEGHAA